MLKTERIAHLALVLLFGVMVAVTWQRWTHPMVDHGRELNLPARILAGERLYVDVSYQYGPFAPYFNALLYRAFGPRVEVLHTSGAVCAFIILLLINRLARRLMSPLEAAVTTGFVLIVCAFNPIGGNYIQPYSYAALYGWTFALTSLFCLVRFLEQRQLYWLCWAGASIGATTICKPEFGLLGIAPASVALALSALEEKRWSWRPVYLVAIPAAVIGGTVYGIFVLRVSWENLILEQYRMFSQPPFIYFDRFLYGALHWPTTLRATIAAIGMALVACGLTAIFGLALAPKVESLWQGHALKIWGCIALGVCLWGVGATPYVDVNPFRTAPIVLFALMGLIARHLRIDMRNNKPTPIEIQILLILAVFGVVSIVRVAFNVSLRSPYTPFSTPVLIVVYLYLFFEMSPQFLLITTGSRRYAKRLAIGLVAIVAMAQAYVHAEIARKRDVFTLQNSRGTMILDSRIGPPTADAVRLAIASTSPGDYVASLPEGTIVNFLADRPNPLREEIVVPGVLTAAREIEAIRRLAQHQVPLILIANILTPEYGARTFGTNYAQALMLWIEDHYRPIASFGPADAETLRFGDNKFFIRAYKRRAAN